MAIRNPCNEGNIRHFRLGKLYRIPAAAVEEFEYQTSPSGASRADSVSYGRMIALGRRRRYQLTARTLKDAEAQSRDRYLKETFQGGDHTISQLWTEYVAYLGDKPTAKTMAYTDKAIQSHFGALRTDQLTIEDSHDYLKLRLSDGRKIGAVHTELGHLRSCMNWAYKKATAITRVPLIGIHQIRHPFAVRMLAAGQPIERVSQYLGHSNIQITQKIYARFLPEHLLCAAGILNFNLAKPKR